VVLIFWEVVLGCFLMDFGFLENCGFLFFDKILVFRNFENCIFDFLKINEFGLSLANFNFLKTVFEILNPKIHHF